MKRPSSLGPALLFTCIATCSASCIESETFVNLPDTGPHDTGPSIDVGVQTSAEDARRVLANVGENVVLHTLRDLVERSRTLETATATYAASLSDADRDAARTAFRNTMEAIQRAEVYQLGPAGPVSLVTAGQGLRDEMYAWPLVNRCRADQETVDPAHASIDTLRLEAINVRGLATIEYLLYETTLNNGCPPSININAMGTWAALGDAGVRRNRAEYAHNAAILVRERAEELVRAWETNFHNQLATAGAGSTVFATSQEGLNALSDALFYVYDIVLDMKLGQPVGIVNCEAESCPEAVESPWSNVSIDNIIANLHAFRAAYLGGEPGADGAGFDDLLRSVGATDLDMRMQQGIEATLTALEAIEGPLATAVVDRNEQVVAAWRALDALMRTLKTELVTVLDLELPMRVEGDND